ncbi:hypothetical protein BV22DRAFT_1053457 [Leucogyrophana mollusca]|uniref:Uncharacterized protein n=1 Tax=Leucogyrophana mollusca TaxID=85980 RepID=A0ACB8C089_9AGAM|nr:hypothetical protein BV22DRAFT_1053457 [Leucogyrophana mollusca]
MSSREPMWYCHQCHAEMRPLMTPDPVCASCHGSFVEKMENPTDDPREFQQHVPGEFEEGYPPGMDSFLLGIHGLLGGQQGPLGRSRPASPTAPRSPERGAVTIPRLYPSHTLMNLYQGGVRFEIRTGPGGGGRSFVLGGPNTLGRAPETSGREVPTMSEFIRRDTEGGPNRERGDITGPLMAQYLMALFGGPHQRGGGDPFAELFNLGSAEGGGGGRWGDYVFNQEALDQVLTQLMENSTAGRPVPATDEIIRDLPRDILMENSPLLEKDCAVCKEQFTLQAEDKDELVVVTLPCKHPFHEGCIVPWLKSSGTCPVCRYALIAQPQQQTPGGSPPPGGSSSSQPGSPSSPPRERSPGPSRRGSGGGAGGGIFHALFGGSGSASSRSPTSRASRTNHRSRASTDSSPGAPSFPGRWSDEVD